MAGAITDQLVQLQNATANSSAKKERSQDLDQDAFLQLMMVQLKTNLKHSNKILKKGEMHNENKFFRNFCSY